MYLTTFQMYLSTFQMYLSKFKNVFVTIRYFSELLIKNTIWFNQLPPARAAANLFAIANRVHNSCLANLHTACNLFSMLSGRVIQQTLNCIFIHQYFVARQCLIVGSAPHGLTK